MSGTTADLVLHVNGENVTQLDVTQGESLDFAIGVNDGNSFPSGLLNQFTLQSDAVFTDYTYLLSDSDGDSIAVLGQNVEEYGFGGFGASSTMTNSNGENVFLNISGNTQDPDASYIDAEFLTQSTQGWNVQTLRIDSTDLFGQSDQVTYQISNNASYHTKAFVGNDGDDAYVMIPTQNNDGTQTGHIFHFQEGANGSYEIDLDSSYVWNDYTYMNGSFIDELDNILYSTGEDLFRINSDDGTSSIVFDSIGNSGYAFIESDFYGYGESSFIVRSDTDYNNGSQETTYSLFSGDITGTTVTESSDGIFSQNPIATIDDSDVQDIINANFSGEITSHSSNFNVTNIQYTASGLGNGHDYAMATGNYSDYELLIWLDAFGSGSDQYIVVDGGAITSDNSATTNGWAFASPWAALENGIVFRDQENVGDWSQPGSTTEISYYVLDFASVFDGDNSVVIDSLDDFSAVYSQSMPYGTDAHPNGWLLTRASFDQDLNPIFSEALSGSGFSLSIESPTAGEAYSTIEFDQYGNATVTHPDGHTLSSWDISGFDYDGDGFINYRISTEAWVDPQTIEAVNPYWQDNEGYFTINVSIPPPVLTTPPPVSTTPSGDDSDANGDSGSGGSVVNQWSSSDQEMLSQKLINDELVPEPQTVNISVNYASTDEGNKYTIDGVQQAQVDFVEGNTYVFDWYYADTHPLRFSTQADGTHAGGVEYTDGVVVDEENYTTTITIGENTPDLHYYCQSHSGMGGPTQFQPIQIGESAHINMVSAAFEELVEAGVGTGDYAYVDRSYGGAVVYAADGATSSIDFVGDENTFILNAASEFDFFGFSYDPNYTDDSEVVVLEGSVGSGTRSIEFGEATAGVEDWDVISFDGLDSSVYIDLSQVDSNYDVTATSYSGATVAYVDGAEGVFGTSQSDSITGDAGRNILHGGEGGDYISGGGGQDLISGGVGADSVYGGAGEDILIDIEGGDVIFGDGSASETNRSDDTFVVGQGTKVMDFDLSPDGTGLSGRANQANDIVFVQVTAASLAAAGFGLQQIYELVSGGPENMDQWRSFVRDLEIEVVASDTTNMQPYNEIRLSIDGNQDGQATNLGSISFLEAGTGSGNYNAVKMKSQLEDILAGFESTTSDNAHVLEQFFGMDSLTASQVAALERAQAAGEDAEEAGGDTAAVVAAIDAELTGESFEAAQAVRDALTAQMSATPSDVIAAVEEVIADAVDVALAATDMDTSLFVPIAVEEIREGTVRTEVIEDRDQALLDIEAGLITREEALGVTTIVDRAPEPEAPSDPAPEAIVVLSNADDKVISTSGADDRFEVVPQVFVDETDTALSNQDAGRDVIVDLASRDEGGAGYGDGGSADGTMGMGDGSSADQSSQIDVGSLGDVVYLEGVSGIDAVNFERFQVGREGENSLKISTTVEGVDENGAVVASNASEVSIFKQFDAMTDRFAIETLEISDTQGNSEYWSLSTAEAVRDGGRITDTYITTDVSNTGKGILIGSDTESDTYVVTGDGAAEIKVVGFDASDTIDLTSFGDDLTTSVNEETGAVEVSDADGIRVTLIGITDPTNIDDQLGISQD